MSIAKITGKKTMVHEHATEFMASRSVFIILFTLFLIPFVRFDYSWTVYVLIYFTSILVVAGGIYINKSLRHGEISVIGPLQNLSPVFLLVIAYFILGETPSLRQLFGIFLLMLGAYSLEVGITKKGFLEPIRVFFKSKIIHYLIFALVVFSFTATLDKFIVLNYADFLSYYFLLSLFKSVNYIALDVYRFGWKDIQRDVKKDFKILFGGGLALFLSHLSYFVAVSFPNAMISLIIPIKRMSTLFTTILGGKLFKERNLLIKVLSCIIMIWGAVFILL